MRVVIVNPYLVVGGALGLACTIGWFTYMCLTDDDEGGGS